MARSDQLRIQRSGTVINTTAKKQESDLIRALRQVEAHIESRFAGELSMGHRKQWYLKDIVATLRHTFPAIEFHCHFDSSSIRPDGGILHIRARSADDGIYPILIAEVKNQGTNDRRRKEGLSKQARGNAIERLGKNLIGLRAALLRESIFPFVCFGYGCDFEQVSSILDRVTTMAMFGELNVTHLHSEGSGRFNRGSFYFREQRWSVDEMAKVMKDIAERSVMYYISKYGRSHFVSEPSPSRTADTWGP